MTSSGDVEAELNIVVRFPKGTEFNVGAVRGLILADLEAAGLDATVRVLNIARWTGKTWDHIGPD